LVDVPLTAAATAIFAAAASWFGSDWTKSPKDPAAIRVIDDGF
jgi:hypothetical protein